MALHDTVNILTAAAVQAVASSILPDPSSATGTATIPEPIPPLPSATHSPPAHPHPGFPAPNGSVFYHIGKGEVVLSWVMCGLFALTLLASLFSSLRRPLPARLLHSLLSLLLLASLASYYAYSTGLGYIYQFLPLPTSSGTVVVYARQVFVGRLVQAMATTPLTIAILGNMAGMPTARILLLAAAGWANEVFCLIGTFVVRSEAYSLPSGGHRTFVPSALGWLLFSLFSIAPPILALLIPGRRLALARSAPTGRLYTFLTLWVVILGLGYWVVLVLGSWFWVIGVKLEFILNCVLDLLTQVVWAWAIMFGLKRVPEAEAVLSEVWTAEGGGGYVYESVAGTEEGAAPVAAA